jgi:hypothetical protein
MGKHLVLVGGGHAHMVTLANLFLLRYGTGDAGKGICARGDPICHPACR